jgi:hypothetical protein
MNLDYTKSRPDEVYNKSSITSTKQLINSATITMVKVVPNFLELLDVTTNIMCYKGNVGFNKGAILNHYAITRHG